MPITLELRGFKKWELCNQSKKIQLRSTNHPVYKHFIALVLESSGMLLCVLFIGNLLKRIQIIHRK